MNNLIVTTRFRGVHNWTDCPIEDVRFLKTPHHHEFLVEATIETRSDRQFEFIEIQCLIDSIVIDKYPNFNKSYSYKNIVAYTAELGSRSCETISRELATTLVETLKTKVTVFVSEDGHYGSSTTISLGGEK